ncbi:MAG: hypothetical protein JRJ59_01150 [Deltaproteobacteria bacterium]|nr:hypothetical protein [Deltaproteobacteria bacterium]
MTWLNRLRGLIREERGVAAVAVIFSLAALVGLTGAAVDMGVLYSARSELQNAADAAALAAAAEMVVGDENGQSVAQPDEALAAAHQYAQAHKSLDVDLTMLSADFTVGRWDHDINDFAYTGFSTDPDDLTAAQVKLRRDTLANSPVNTFFAKLLGIDNVPVAATSVAYLGYAGSVPPEGAEVPIVVTPDKVSDGDNPYCDTWIIVDDYPSNESGTGWTTFKLYNQTTSKLRKYARGVWTAPELAVGDEIYVFGWDISYKVFRDLKRRFEDLEVEEWLVTVPVVMRPGAQEGPIYMCHSRTPVEIVGFARMAITEVKQHYEDGVNQVVCRLICDVTQESSRTGGRNFGARASLPVTIN